MQIIAWILYIILIILALIVVLLCLPVFLELQIKKVDEFDGTFDIVFWYGALRISGKLFEQGTVLNIKAFNHQITDDKAKGQSEKKENEKANKKDKHKKVKKQNLEKQKRSLVGTFHYIRRLVKSKGTIKCIMKFLNRFKKSLKITKLACNGKVSIGDADNYGYAWAAYSAVKPFTNGNLDLNINYEKYDFEGSMELKAKVSSRKVLISVILFLISKPVIKIIYNILKRKDELYGI